MKDKTSSRNWRDNLKLVWECLTNLGSYRLLAVRPLKEAVIYAALLTLLPVLIWSGIQIHFLNKLTLEIIHALQGHLPALRIDDGKVFMEGDTFRFEKEIEYPVSDWAKLVSAYPSPDRAVRGKASSWIKENFPGPAAKVSRSQVEARLQARPAERPDTAQMLRATSNFGSFVFLVDLTGKEPEFPPGAWGFALSKEEYYLKFFDKPFKRSFSKETSAVVNEQTLERWRRLIVWHQIPFVVILPTYLLGLVIVTIIILFGCLLSLTTAAFMKAQLVLKKAGIIAIYALTPAILFISILRIILLFTPWHPYPLQTIGTGMILYAVYVISAVRSCCSLG